MKIQLGRQIILMGNIDPSMIMSLMGGGEGGGMGPKKSPILPMAIGAGQLGLSAIQNRKADAAAPSPDDAEMRRYLNEIDLKRKALSTGAGFGAGKRLIEQNKATTDEAITRGAGGDAGMAQQGLLRSQRNANAGMNTVLGQGEQRQQFFTSLGQDILNRMSARRLDLGMFDRLNHLAQAKQYQTDAMQNLGVGAAKAVPLDDGSITGMADLMKRRQTGSNATAPLMTDVTGMRPDAGAVEANVGYNVNNAPYTWNGFQ